MVPFQLRYPDVVDGNVGKRWGWVAGSAASAGYGCAVGTRAHRPPCSARLPERPGPPAYEVGSAALPGAKDLGFLVFARPPVLRPWRRIGRGGHAPTAVVAHRPRGARANGRGGASAEGGTRQRPWWCIGRGPSAASRRAQPGERAERRGRQDDAPRMEADGMIHPGPGRCMGRWAPLPRARRSMGRWGRAMRGG